MLLAYLSLAYIVLIFFSLAFHKAGRRDQAVKVLEQLCHNAVVEHRLLSFSDFFYKLEHPCRNSKCCSNKHRQSYEPIGYEPISLCFASVMKQSEASK